VTAPDSELSERHAQEVGTSPLLPAVVRFG
jgi:hypothetical protein